MSILPLNMRTYAMGVADAQSKLAGNVKPINFTYGVATDKPGFLRGVYSFSDNTKTSFIVPTEDTEFLKGIGETVGKFSGASSTPLGSGINSVMGKLGLKGAPIVEQVRTVGIIPVLIVLTIFVIVGRAIWKKLKKRKRR